ncbi:MAG: DUF3488 domain-containing transglutaminase family protein [Gammaproteobacteria bacterium]|nr:DUF3488 domain-containing transglutaminase family protein [Gammaproteobacteria bacterium]
MNTSGTLISRNGIFWLACMLVLTQLPHVLHLPVWVSIAGIGLIVGKASYTREFSRYFPSWFLVVLALAAAFGVRLHFGYFLGRDPCVAFLFLLVALKFAETRQRRDVTLLICLSGFLLFTQYFYSQTLLAALVSLPAVFAMGGCLFVLRDYSHNPGVKPVLKLIGKLLLQGVPIAAALFVLFPRLSSPLWSLPQDARSSSGLSNSMAPGSISELSLSDAVAFRVEFDDEVPAKQDLYWRGPVFSVFNGREWFPAPQTDTIEPVVMDKPLTSYTVTLEPHHNRWLFALDMAASLPIDTAHAEALAEPIARLDNEGRLIANKPVDSAIRYRQSSYISNSFAEFGPGLMFNSKTAGGNLQSQRFAQQLRSRYHDDNALIQAVLQWFNSQPFYYTLTPSLLGNDPVDEFLFKTREGFCEHYASAFAYLLRAAAIPARVVTGYQGGEMNEDYLIVRQSDAHAWTEAWVDGAWRRYDPTAAVAPSRVLNGMASALGDNEPVPFFARTDKGWLKKIRLGWDALNHRWRKHVVDFSLDRQLEFFRKIGMPQPQPWQIMTAMLLVGAIWALMILKLHLRFGSSLSDAERLWCRFLEKIQAAGLPQDNTLGPLTICEKASKRWPQQAEQFREVTDLFIRLHFSPAGDDQEQRKMLLSRLRHSLRHIPPLRQLRAS